MSGNQRELVKVMVQEMLNNLTEQHEELGDTADFLSDPRNLEVEGGALTLNNSEMRLIEEMKKVARNLEKAHLKAIQKISRRIHGGGLEELLSATQFFDDNTEESNEDYLDDFPEDVIYSDDDLSEESNYDKDTQPQGDEFEADIPFWVNNR